MSEKNIPFTIVENRRKTEKRFAENYAVTEAQLAEFFQVPIKVIKKDIVASNIKLDNSLKEFPMNRMMRITYNRATNLESKGLSREEALAECGFWREASFYCVACGDFEPNVEDKDRQEKLRKAYPMVKVGYTIADVKLICELQLKDVEYLKKVTKELEIDNIFQEWAEEQFEVNKKNIEAIKDAVGASVTKIKKGKDYYAEKKAQNQLPKSVYQPKTPDDVRAKRKEECYQEWINGKKTQAELARKYGVYRETIGNWIREMKAKDTDDIDSLKDRRNISKAGQNNSNKQKAKRRENCLNKIRPLIDEAASLNHMAKVSGNCAETIKRYMRDEGLWEDYLKKRPELNG